MNIAEAQAVQPILAASPDRNLAGREEPQRAPNMRPLIKDSIYTVPGVILKGAIGYTYNASGQLVTIVDPMLGRKVDIKS